MQSCFNKNAVFALNRESECKFNNSLTSDIKISKYKSLHQNFLLTKAINKNTSRGKSRVQIPSETVVK
jgi:hypothetical protein